MHLDEKKNRTTAEAETKSDSERESLDKESDTRESSGGPKHSVKDKESNTSKSSDRPKRSIKPCEDEFIM